MFCAASAGASFALAATAVISCGMRPARATCGSCSISVWIRFASDDAPTRRVHADDRVLDLDRVEEAGIRRLGPASTRGRRQRDAAPEPDRQRETQPRFPPDTRLEPQPIPDRARGTTFPMSCSAGHGDPVGFQSHIEPDHGSGTQVAGALRRVVLASPSA